MINFQECITAESYIRQYNNWCDELSRYQRALNEWEDLKDKVNILSKLNLSISLIIIFTCRLAEHQMTDINKSSIVNFFFLIVSNQISNKKHANF